MMSAAYQHRDDSAIDYGKCKDIIFTMATCHSLRVVDGEFLGDPLDVKMFEFTDWSYEEGGTSSDDQDPDKGDTIAPSVARPPQRSYEIPDEQVRTRYTLENVETFLTERQSNLELGVLRSFEFVSQLRRTSVIVRRFGDQGASVFVKGAPECMRDICLPETCE